jgi:hypothetical protein
VPIIKSAGMLHFGSELREPQAHDRIAVNASKALHRPDAHAFRQGCDDLDLLVAWQDVHDGDLS